MTEDIKVEEVTPAPATEAPKAKEDEFNKIIGEVHSYYKTLVTNITNEFNNKSGRQIVVSSIVGFVLGIILMHAFVFGPDKITLKAIKDLGAKVSTDISTKQITCPVVKKTSCHKATVMGLE